MSKKTLIIIQIILWSCIIVFLSGSFAYAVISENKKSSTDIRGGGHMLEYGVHIEDINYLEVRLVSENLYIYETGEPYIIIKQIANKDIPEDEKLRVVQQGNKVKIEKRKDRGIQLFHFTNWNLNEKIEVYIPKTYNQGINLKTVSGEIEVNNVDVKEINCKTTSGDISVENLTAQEMNVDTTSGDIKMKKVLLDTVDSSCVSGNLEVEGICLNIGSKTVSGNIEVELEDQPKQIRMESVSGDIELTFAKIDGFNLEFSSTSGKLKSDFELSMEGNRQYTYNKGSAKLKIKTVSGDLEINKN